MFKIFNFQFSIFNKLSVKKNRYLKFFDHWNLIIDHSRFSSGFTLIELMIVIAILAGLATMFMSTFPAAQKRGRDTKRKSDIKQYQTSLEVYANKKGDYSGLANGNIVSNCSVLGIGSTCPDDPSGGSNHYSVAASAASYVLWTKLEQPAVVGSPYFIVCSNGKSGECASAPSGATWCATSTCP